MAAPSFVTSIPANVRTALENILESVPGSEVRSAIVTALTWGMNNAIAVGNFINSLGLCVENGMLCYTTRNMLPVYSGIPSEISSYLNRIQNAKYGRDTRQAIVEALRWGGNYTSEVAGFIEDLGLTVRDGKLCAIYNVHDDATNEALYYNSVYAGGEVGDEGIPYIGVKELEKD